MDFNSDQAEGTEPATVVQVRRVEGTLQMDCGKCGAALPLELATDGTVTCRYCGTTARVPVEAHHATVDAADDASSRAVSSAVLAIAGLGAVVLGLVGVASLAMTVTAEEAPIEEFAEAVARAVSEPAMRDAWKPFCLVDADGDEHLDVVVEGYARGGSDAFVWLYAGADGALLWHQRLEDGHALHCLSSTWFAVQSPVFDTQLYPSKAPRTGPRVRLSDEVLASAGDGDCVAFTTRDQRTTVLSMPDGTVSDCSAPTPTHANHNVHHWNRYAVRRFTSDGVDVVVSKKDGTPTIRVEATGATRWSVALPYVKSAFGTPLFLQKGTLVVLAERLGEQEDRVFAVGIDVLSGELLYEVAVPVGITGYHGWTQPAGERFVVIADHVLSVRDPRTGEAVWSR